jgi:glycosyltransferase involved in cell wall biosynthesis
VRRQPWDVIYVFSGVAEELLRHPSDDSTLRMVARASAHICTQDRLLREEEVRTGAAQDRPSRWMIQREMREYGLADAIRVLSTFAYNSFIAEGVASQRLRLILSGVEIGAFRASQESVEDRCRRIVSGAPLRVLNVGTFSFRKGAWDIAEVINQLDSDRFEFRFVGPIASEATGVARKLRGKATLVPKVPQAQLPSIYAWADLFVLPTIEDGFPAVLGQAAAAGLPILTTPNGAGHDLVHDGRNGWVLPIRSPEAIVDRLRWADRHRGELVSVVRASRRALQVRDSAEVAADFERVCEEYLETPVVV